MRVVRALTARAQIRAVRVTADDEANRAVELVELGQQIAVGAGAGRIVVADRREDPLMDQHHHRVDALRVNRRQQRIDRVRLVGEVQAAHSRGGRDDRRVMQDDADERDADALAVPGIEVLDCVRRKERLAGGIVDHVGGEIFVFGAAERAVDQARVDADLPGRPAPAALLAQQLGFAFVELVVAHRRELEAHRVEGLDRRLIVKERGTERARADHVTGTDDDVARVAGFEIADHGRQISRESR